MKISKRKTRWIGHCMRYDEKSSFILVFWQADSCKKNRKKKRTTFVDKLINDQSTTEELSTAVMGHKHWISR